MTTGLMLVALYFSHGKDAEVLVFDLHEGDVK
jgi:hypothetical protein